MIDTEKLIDGFTASALFLKDEKSNETLKSMTIKKFYKKDQNANEFEKYFQTYQLMRLPYTHNRLSIRLVLALRF